MFGLNLIFFIFIAILILGGNYLGYTLVAAGICLASALVYLMLTAYWIPLQPASPIYEQTERKPHKWYQAPALWIAGIGTLVVWGWQSLGLE